MALKLLSMGNSAMVDEALRAAKILTPTVNANKLNQLAIGTVEYRETGVFLRLGISAG
jgi:hypothetical protein